MVVGVGDSKIGSIPNNNTLTEVLVKDATGLVHYRDAASLISAETDPKVGTLSTNKVPNWNGTLLQDGLISDDGIRVSISSDATVNNLTIGKGKAGETTNTALGYATLFSDTNSVRNTAVGFEVLFHNVDASYNTAVGFRSQYETYTGGGGNSSMGYFSLSKNYSGANNTSVGGWSMRENTT